MNKKIFNFRQVAIMIACLTGSVTISAQDIIIMKDSSEYQAVVQEVGVSEVKYKRFDNQNRTNNQQDLPVLKYTTGKQISPHGAEKNQSLAGFLSFLIPGAGQFYNGDVDAGLLFMGVNIVCNYIWMSSVETRYYGNYIIDKTTFTIGFIGALVINVSSIVHASQGAKKVNIARGYRLADNTYLNIKPTIIQQNNLLASKGAAYGMSFCLNF